MAGTTSMVEVLLFVHDGPMNHIFRKPRLLLLHCRRPSPWTCCAEIPFTSVSSQTKAEATRYLSRYLSKQSSIEDWLEWCPDLLASSYGYYGNGAAYEGAVDRRSNNSELMDLEPS